MLHEAGNIRRMFYTIVGFSLVMFDCLEQKSPEESESEVSGDRREMPTGHKFVQ